MIRWLYIGILASGAASELHMGLPRDVAIWKSMVLRQGTSITWLALQNRPRWTLFVRPLVPSQSGLCRHTHYLYMNMYICVWWLLSYFCSMTKEKISSSLLYDTCKSDKNLHANISLPSSSSLIDIFFFHSNCAQTLGHGETPYTEHKPWANTCPVSLLVLPLTDCVSLSISLKHLSLVFIK